MMTIEELQLSLWRDGCAAIEKLGSRIGLTVDMMLPAEIVNGIALHIQKLDMELTAAQARMEAAAGIGEDVAAQDFPLYYAYSDGANSMRELFRAALGIE